MSSLPSNLAAVELWPIRAKGAVTRLSPFSDPAITQFYQKSIEEGRLLENSIADANDQLLKRKQQLYDLITNYAHMQSIGVNGQLKYTPRVIKLANDVVQIINVITTIQGELRGVLGALTQNLTILASIERSLLQEVQTTLNSLANLLQNICNWGLPSLPSLPNLFPDGLWNWQGFNFSPLFNLSQLFKPNLPNLSAFSQFSFSQCSLMNLGLVNNPSTNNPLQITGYSGNTLGTPPTILPAPLNGLILNSPTQAQLNQTVTPVYSATTFNPNTSMIGSLPDPSTILSDYQMPSATYQSNILSLIPATLNQVIEPTDADYTNPNYGVRNPLEVKSLATSITLGEVVASNYDPYIVSAWLFYLSLNFTGRAGLWLPNFAQLYSAVILPSLTSLSQNAVPFNNFTGTVVDTPTDIPLTDLLKNLSPGLLQNMLWKLSYIEASLLGYTRNKTWDSGADTLFTASFTSVDLDYEVTLISAEVTTLILGQTTAQYPVPCTFPSSLTTVLNEVITIATADINATSNYLSPHPQYRYVYNQFAQATVVDRFSQFWREFNSNLIVFLSMDPYVVQRVASYPQTLDGVLNPLANTVDIAAYNQVLSDSLTRNRSWIPGSDLLTLPIAPVVAFSNTTTPPNTGWSGTTFNSQAYLNRPDIQALPIPTQMAMLRTNISYAGIMQFSQNLQAEIQTQMNSINAALAQISTLGFYTSDVTAVTGVGETPTPIEFDSITAPNDFDLTGYTAIPPGTTFTIQNSGVFSITGQLNWSGGGPGTYTIQITQNGGVVFQSEPMVGSGTFTQQFVSNGGFNQGDEIQVLAYTTATGSGSPPNIFVGSGSFFSMILSIPTPGLPPGPIPPVSQLGATKTFTADGNFPIGTAVRVDSSGNVVAVDPTIGKPGPPVPYVDGIATSIGVAGQPVDVIVSYGSYVQVSGLPAFTVGQGIYVGISGLVTQPNPNLTWTIYVGIALSDNTFLFEPHIPQ
jgi:hypothetical protein